MLRSTLLASALLLATMPAALAGKCTSIGGNGVQAECVDNQMPIGSVALATSQASVTSTAAQALPARVTRNAVIVQNTGTADAFVGSAGVTTATGFKVAAGTISAPLPTQAALYAVTASGTTTLAFFETY